MTEGVYIMFALSIRLRMWWASISTAVLF